MATAKKHVDGEPLEVKGAEHVTAPGNSNIAGGRTDGAIVTSTPPAEADKSSYPNADDAKLHDPPVRTPKSDTPIGVSLATGAGQHVPPDPDEYDAMGRVRD